ncbi:MAG: TolC family outer membrane protein [Roseivivax sp.]|nr:TolC family outer membrane protein [Roseivivax sp.]
MLRVHKALTRSARIGLAVLALSLPASAETLTQALVSAYNHSGLLDQNRALLRAADEDVAQSVAALRPVIGWSAEVSRAFGTTRSTSTGGRTIGFVNNEATIGLAAEMTLFDNGATRLAGEAAKEAVLATRQQLIAVEQSVLLRAVSAFMEVRRATETAAVRDSNVRLIAEELRAANDRFDVGEITRTDVAQAEARLAAARSALAAASGALDVARAEYAAAIGHKPGALTPPSRLPSLPGMANAIDTAQRGHPSVLAAQHQVAAAELAIARADAAMKPKVTLGARLGMTDDLDSSNFTHSGSVTLGVSGPIYQGGRLSSLKRQAMAQRDAARNGLLVTGQTLRRDVENAYAQFNVARASRDASERQIRASQVAFRGVREEASLGARTTLDVLNAEQELLDARVGLISATVDETVAAYVVLASIGLLTADHMNLAVQRYDPEAYYNLVKSAPIARSAQGKQLDRVLQALGKE